MLKTLVRLAVRNTTRKLARTLFTAGMVVAGVALLVLGLTWIDGVTGQMLREAGNISGHVRLVTRAYADREILAPLYENIPEIEPVEAMLLARKGVIGVEPRIVTGGTVTVGEEIGDVFARVVAARRSYFVDRVRADEKLQEGRWFADDADEVVVGHRVAEQLGAKVGQEIVLLGMTQYGSMSPIKGRLVGITKRGSSILDGQVMVPLSKGQWLTDIPTGATELLVYTDRYQDGPALGARLRASEIFQSNKYDISAWTEREPWASMMGSMKGVRGFVVFLIVLLTALGIWNTVMMSVLERRHEIGVLRAMGMARRSVVALFVGESLAIAGVGGLVGAALGSIPSWLLEKYGVHLGEQAVSASEIPLSETMYGDLTLQVVMIAFGLGLVMALVGSLVPAFRAASVPPVTAMRSGR